MKYRVCRVEEIPSGQKRRYTVKNIPLVVVHSVHGGFYAVYEFCPHQRASLGDGVLGGMTFARQPGAKFDYVREGEILRCPWHNYCFDVKTGLCLTEPQKFRVKTYPILIEDQEVFLDL